MKINILDNNFAHHSNNSVAYKQHNEFFDWYRGNDVVSKSIFFTDLHLKDVDRVKNAQRKVGWILEPRAINPAIYEWIQLNNKKFDFILTFDKQLLDKGENYIFYPFGVTWVSDRLPRDYEKTKFISIIGSNKSMTPGHAFRKQVIDYCLKRGDVDVYGRGYNEINSKEEGLNDYMFSIVMENSQADWYFSEKLIDCFVTQTLPIYWGCNVSDYFADDSYIKFQTIEDLDKIINCLTADLYMKKKDTLRKTQQIVYDKSLDVPECWMYKNYPFLFK